MLQNTAISDDLNIERAKLLGSLLLFTQFFYKKRTAREFEISQPIGRESHHITVFKHLKKAFSLEIPFLLINIPPGHGKSEILIHFVAWAMAHYPDSNFLYISCSAELASKHTYTIKQIMEMPYYRELFGVSLRSDSSAKDNFMTESGGSVQAFGSEGTIIGQNAGLPHVDRFSGAIIMDDMHKPDEVSDSARKRVINNYNQTIKYRRRGTNVPVIFLGQRVFEDDLPDFFIKGKDGNDWTKIILPSLGNTPERHALYPSQFSKEWLLNEEKYNRFVFAAQHQQNPQSAGAGIYKEEYFTLLDEQPDILTTFITADSAETDKNYNDATVFSFWGIYKIKHGYVETDLYGLVWLDCIEVWVEPKDLEKTFWDFYASCMRHDVKPKMACIEKKSTGVTLSSVLSSVQGLQIIDLPRLKSKIDRFLEAQPYVAAKHVAFIRYAKHTQMCIEHCKKITANNSHARDDIADTLADAIKIALIDKTVLIGFTQSSKETDEIVSMIANQHRITQQMRKSACQNL